MKISDHLTQIEGRLIRIEEKQDNFLEMGVATKAKAEGHSTQLAMLWTAILSCLGYIVTRMFIK
jgi:hypothetical protein